MQMPITLPHNFTLGKIVKYGIASGIGASIVAGGTFLLTNYIGIYYVTSTIISGTIAFAIKFMINALWTFRE